ncbi:MAG: hypothetical protein ACJAYU_003399 [Bradymonadia bacterium]|jgi:hypothetical protein
MRVVVGLATWYEATQNVARIGQYTPGQLHLPYFGTLNWDANQLHALCEWQMRFAVAVVLGLFTRVFALAALVCQASLFLVSQLNFRNHIYLMLLLLLLLSFAHADRAFSINVLIRRALGKATPRVVPSLPARLIQAQILIIYLYSGLHKLLLDFGNGYALCRFLGRDLSRGRSGNFFSESELEWISTYLSREGCTDAAPAFIIVGSIGTIVAELGLAVSFGARRGVLAAIIVGVGMHTTIWWSMDVVTFGMMMVATYPLFLVSPPYSEALRKGDDATPAIWLPWRRDKNAQTAKSSAAEA